MDMSASAPAVEAGLARDDVVVPATSAFRTVATVAVAGDPQRYGARGSMLQLHDSEIDYSTAPAHLCFWVPVSGAITVHPHRGNAYGISGERVTMIPPGSVWRGAWRGRMETMMLEISPAILAEFSHRTIAHPGGGSLQMVEDETLRHSILALRHRLASPLPDDGLFAGHIARAVASHYLQRYCGSAATADADHHRLSTAELQRTLELIDAKLGEKLALEELAEPLDLSVASFCRRFKRSVGLPPYQYVLRTRIERAKAQLAQRGRSASEIALSLGFYDQAQFSNAFRRIVGLTPREYRRRVMN